MGVFVFPEDKQLLDLYSLQETVLLKLKTMGDAQFDTAKLCGGTALSRCWMQHRVSYDLDFFLPYGFRSAEMATSLKRAGIIYEVKDIVDDPRKANQLHGYIVENGSRLKVSFVEDAYFETFPVVAAKFGSLVVATEEMPGLYHRKLRTVSGHATEGDSFVGGRQTARDLFDLYVLAANYQPIREFIQSLPYTFPSSAFDNGLANMPWFDLMDELEEIICPEQWRQAKDVNFLQDFLYQQIGATVLTDEFFEDERSEASPREKG